jgi:hypothetical protein
VPASWFSLQKNLNVYLQLVAVAQRLYEAGFITYMRTDSTFLSDDAVSMVRAHIVAACCSVEVIYGALGFTLVGLSSRCATLYSAPFKTSNKASVSAIQVHRISLQRCNKLQVHV